MTRASVGCFVSMVFGGCTFSPSGGTSGTAGSGAHPPLGGFGGTQSQGPCTGLACQQSTRQMGSCTQPPCMGGAVTRLTGTVYDPAGKVPLPNVDVFVPNAALAPYNDGPS